MSEWGAGMFWSQSARGWLGYFETQPDNLLVLRHEQVFKGMTPDMAAKEIRIFTARVKLPLPPIVVQSALFPSRDGRGETVSETFARAGVPLVRGDDDLLNGWSRVRSWLSPRPPIFRVHQDCKYFLKTFSTLLEDPASPDELLEVPEAYPAHGLRLFLMSRPSPMEAPPAPEPQEGTWGFALKHLREPRRRFIGDYLR